MRSVLALGIGGFIGAILRYSVQQLFSTNSGVFPVSTFIVNIVGCFVIGVLYGIVSRYDLLGRDIQLFLITGLCGSFTTFSTFSIESVSLLNKGNYTIFFIYIFSSVIIGILMTILGITLIKNI